MRPSAQKRRGVGERKKVSACGERGADFDVWGTQLRGCRNPVNASEPFRRSDRRLATGLACIQTVAGDARPLGMAIVVVRVIMGSRLVHRAGAATHRLRLHAGKEREAEKDGKQARRERAFHGFRWEGMRARNAAQDKEIDRFTLVS